MKKTLKQILRILDSQNTFLSGRVEGSIIRDTMLTGNMNDFLLHCKYEAQRDPGQCAWASFLFLSFDLTA